MSNEPLKSNETVEIVLDTDLRSIVPEYEQGEMLADRIIKEMEEKDDLYHGLNYLSMFQKVGKIAGIAACKVLHHMNTHRKGKFKSDQDFYMTVRSYTGYGLATIKRYISIWELFATNKIPSQYVNDIKQKPINSLVPIVGTVNAGYDVADEYWEEIIDARNNPEISRILREKVKGQEPSDRAIYFQTDKTTGLIYAVNQGKRYVIGKFALNNTEDVAVRGMKRIIENLKMEVTED